MTIEPNNCMPSVSLGTIDASYDSLERQVHPLMEQELIIESLAGLSASSGLHIGVDSESRRHLLFEVSKDYPLESLNLASLELSVKKFNISSESNLLLDLACLDSSLKGIFSHLVVDIIREFQVGRRGGVAIIKSVVKKWQRLLKELGPQLSREEALGLVGELEVLERLAKIDPSTALDVWQNSERALHDIRGLHATIEVKSWSAAKSPVHFIGQLEQLESQDDNTPLYFASVELAAEDSSECLTDRCMRLVSLGVSLVRLQELIARRGFLFVVGNDDSFRFRTVSLKFWYVDDDFPRLSLRCLQGEAAQRISRISYQVDVSNLGNELSKKMQDKIFMAVLGYE